VIWKVGDELNQLFHVYECEDCSVTFAVEQAFEDQSEVKCPICLDDEWIRDVGSGEMILGGDEV
jgi:predicted nucleic acid-binding Zn ribbon protein